MGQNATKNKNYEKLLDKLDDVTTKTETLSHFPDDIKTMRTQIELKWLERKELMRQEFASLLDTLTTQQHKLMADLEEEVSKSLDSLQQLQQTHGAVLSDTCQLSDECISAVQNLPRDQFISSYPQFVDSLKAVESEMDGMESAQSHVPAFLQVPFSLHSEKTHLHHCLQAPVFTFCGLVKRGGEGSGGHTYTTGMKDVQSIRARDYQRFVPLERLKEEVTVTMLLDTPTPNQLPPSSTLRYKVRIFCGSKQSKKPVWSSRRPLRALDPVINGIHGHQLLPGNLYVVKIQPIVNCLSHQGVQSVEGRTVSILIVTDSAGRGAFEPVMAAGDNQALADTCSLLNSAFEDNMEQGNLFCINMAVESAAAAGSSSNNNNNRAREQSSRRNRCVKEHSKQNRNYNGSKPSIDRLMSAPVVCNGKRVSPSGQGECLSSRACYSCAVPSLQADRACPVPAEDLGDALCIQRRYIADCSFEEARLVEDNSLRVSRVVLFDR